MDSNTMLTFLDAWGSGDTSGAIERSEKREQQNAVRNGRLPIKTNDMGVPREIRSKGITDDMRDDYKKQIEIEAENNKQWTKEQYEKMGIKIIEKYDDLFLNVELPEGWKIKATDHSMWNDVFDDKDRKRMTFFYKGAFYDRDAFVNFERRFYSNCKVNDFDEILFEVKPKKIKSGKKTIWVDRNDREIDVSKIDLDNDCWDYKYYDNYTYRRTEKYRKVEVDNYIPNPDYIPMTGYEKYSQPFHYEVHDFDGFILFKSNIVKTDYEYSEDNHWGFWKHHDEIENRAKEQCLNWLKENYPNWEDFHQYWE